MIWRRIRVSVGKTESVDEKTKSEVENIESDAEKIKSERREDRK